MSRFARPLLGITLALAIMLSLVGQTVLASDSPAVARADGTPTPGPRTAALSELKNAVFARLTAGVAEQLASNGQTVQEGGSIRTGAASSARLDFSDGTLVRIKENTTFTVTALETESGDPFTQLSLAVGKLWIILSGGVAEVNTPVGVASVRGSFMGVSYDPSLKEIKVTCLETIFTCTVIVGGMTHELQMGQQLSAPPFDHPRIETIDLGEHREWTVLNPESAPFIDPDSIVKDQDNDSVPDQFDNCPIHFNSDQADNDSDGIGNACESSNAEASGAESEPTLTPTATETEDEQSGFLGVSGGNPPSSQAPDSPFLLGLAILLVTAALTVTARNSAQRARAHQA